MALLVGDDQPQIEFPWATISLVLLCWFAYAWSQHWHVVFYPERRDLDIDGFVTIPARILGHYSLPDGVRRAPAWLTPLTSAFLDADVVHLVGNLLFLWVFGKHVEDCFGIKLYLILVVVLAYASNGVEIALHPFERTHFLGASGFISGIMGAYLAVFPKAHLKFGYFNLSRDWAEYRVSAWIWLGLWIGKQVYLAVHVGEAALGVAVLAHITGFLGGAILGRLLYELGIVATYDPRLVEDSD